MPICPNNAIQSVGHRVDNVLDFLEENARPFIAYHGAQLDEVTSTATTLFANATTPITSATTTKYFSTTPCTYLTTCENPYR
jgi:hypothetical protein